MRPYSDFEQERILRAVVQREDPPISGHAQLADGARESHNDTQTLDTEPQTAQEDPRGETPEIVQLLVDIESESKFTTLLRSIQRRLHWFL